MKTQPSLSVDALFDIAENVRSDNPNCKRDYCHCLRYVIREARKSHPNARWPENFLSLKHTTMEVCRKLFRCQLWDLMLYITTSHKVCKCMKIFTMAVIVQVVSHGNPSEHSRCIAGDALEFMFNNATLSFFHENQQKRIPTTALVMINDLQMHHQKRDDWVDEIMEILKRREFTISMEEFCYDNPLMTLDDSPWSFGGRDALYRHLGVNFADADQILVLSHPHGASWVRHYNGHDETIANPCLFLLSNILSKTSFEDIIDVWDQDDLILDDIQNVIMHIFKAICEHNERTSQLLLETCGKMWEGFLEYFRNHYSGCGLDVEIARPEHILLGDKSAITNTAEQCITYIYEHMTPFHLEFDGDVFFVMNLDECTKGEIQQKLGGEPLEFLPLSEDNLCFGESETQFCKIVCPSVELCKYWARKRTNKRAAHQ